MIARDPPDLDDPTRYEEFVYWAKEWLGEVRAPRDAPRPPERLYHYTSAAGLIGMLETGRLWATNLRYMNDLSEIRYANGVLDRVLAERIEATRTGFVRRFLEHAKRSAKLHDTRFDAYSFSLCADGDDLNQWRVYAEKGTGYALGFDGERLEAAAWRSREASGSNDFALVPVAYAEDTQVEILSRAVEHFCAVAERAWERGSQKHEERVVNAYGVVFMMVMSELLYAFKSDVFRHENEWRLVHARLSDDMLHTLRFRAGRENGLVVPYLELDVAAPGEARLPLREIVQGPIRAAESGTQSLRLLLRKQAYDGLRVKPSRVPLRF